MTYIPSLVQRSPSRVSLYSLVWASNKIHSNGKYYSVFSSFHIFTMYYVSSSISLNLVTDFISIRCHNETLKLNTPYKGKKRVKISLQQAVKAYRLVRRRGSHVFSRQSARRRR
jgi:hypothetical protein